jgi:hypothetical protein
LKFTDIVAMKDITDFKDIRHQTEELEDTKGVIRIRISKNRQNNSQKKKYKRTNNDLQNIHIKLDRVTRTPLKTGGKLGCSGSV